MAARRRHAARRDLHDLERHAQDLRERTGFTYTVLAPGTEEVIGRVYIYPPGTTSTTGGPILGPRRPRRVDPVLHAAVSRWLAEHWPFERPLYAPRPG